MGGATGEAYTNTLFGTGMTPAEVLAREAIQNSSDAPKAKDDGKVRVVFRRVTLSGTIKKKFVKALGLESEFATRKTVLELQQGNCARHLTRDEVPLETLYIEDFNTHGLYGAPHDPTSHFFRLLLSLGDGTKSREKVGSGGSYGYGKSVYSANSRIHTIVAYSVFSPRDDHSSHHARLMGCAYFNAHEHQGAHHTGRAWFGLPSKIQEGDVEPLHDEAAHELAEALGFKRRGKTETGTSILIVDSSVDCEQLRSSIEDWWWPSLVDDALDVELFEQGKPLEPPRPRKRPHLRPFIMCYDLALRRAEPMGPQHKAGTLNRMPNGVSPGDYGLAILGEDEFSDERLQELARSIALIRSPRMVVSYFHVGGGLPLPCVGAFVASEEADKPLKLSEPASHDKWDPRSARLNNLKQEDRELVDAILNRLKLALRKFSNDAAPAVPKDEIRLTSLERLLGNIFRPPTGGGGGGGGYSDPIEINFVDPPHPVADREGIRTQGSFRLSLAEDAEKKRINAAIEVECLVVEDEGLSREDPIQVNVSTKDVEYHVDKENPSRLYVKLEKDVQPLFTFKSDRYQTDWSTTVSVNVEEV
jgi:hypothetical protein